MTLPFVRHSVATLLSNSDCVTCEHHIDGMASPVHTRDSRGRVLLFSATGSTRRLLGTSLGGNVSLWHARCSCILEYAKKIDSTL